MSENITDVDAFTDPVTTISDGEILNNANLKAAVQKLANRTRHLYLHGRVIDVQAQSGIALFGMSSSTWTDVTGSTVILGDGGVAGDRLAIDLFCFLNDGLDKISIRVVVHDSGADSILAESVVKVGPGAVPAYLPAGFPVNMCLKHILAGTGGATVRLQVKNDDNASAVQFLGGQNCLRVTQMRL